MLDIRTRIRADLDHSKRIRSRIRSKNIRTVSPLGTAEGEPEHTAAGEQFDVPSTQAPS